MRKSYPTPSLFRYKIFRGLSRGLLSLYYRNIEVRGRSFIPHEGKALLLANHQAGLVDGLAIVTSVEVPIRTVLKHTLLENPVIGLFAKSLRMIPVFRKQDLSADEAAKSTKDRNRESFEMVSQALIQKSCVLLFPEGRSHDESRLQRLRSGAARMMLNTESSKDFRLGLKWVPVSLDFESKDIMGSRLLVAFHPARSIQHLREVWHTDSEKAVELLRSEMEERLREITINFDSWEDRILIERLCDVWLSRSPKTGFVDKHNLILRWKTIQEGTQTESADEWRILAHEVQELERTLSLAGLSLREVIESDPNARPRFYWRALARVLLGGPIVFVAMTFWGLPTALIRWVTRQGAKTRDVIPSYRLVAGTIAYPVWAALLFPWIGFTVAALMTASGIIALVVARRLSPALRTTARLLTLGSIHTFVADTQQCSERIERLGALLWNRALRRQVLLEGSNPTAR